MGGRRASLQLKKDLGQNSILGNFRVKMKIGKDPETKCKFRKYDNFLEQQSMNIKYRKKDNFKIWLWNIWLTCKFPYYILESFMLEPYNTAAVWQYFFWTSFCKVMCYRISFSQFLCSLFHLYLKGKLVAEEADFTVSFKLRWDRDVCVCVWGRVTFLAFFFYFF